MLVSVHIYPNGKTYRSVPMEDSIIERWVFRSIREHGYMGHKYWVEDVDGNVINYEEHLDGSTTRLN